MLEDPPEDVPPPPPPPPGYGFRLGWHALPPGLVERFEAVEAKAVVVDEIAARLDRLEARLAQLDAFR